MILQGGGVHGNAILSKFHIEDVAVVEHRWGRGARVWLLGRLYNCCGNGYFLGAVRPWGGSGQ